jgi:hypothetical protein
MLKTIKFNLQMDGYPIRNIDDLKTHFNINEVVEYFRSGLLQRWLKVRGMDDLFDAISKIEENDDLGLAKKLIQLFEIEMDEEKIEEQIYILKYQKERELQYEQYRETALDVQKVIADYHQGYASLVHQLMDKKDDFAFIKATIGEIMKYYEGLFRLNARFFYETFLEKGPLVIFGVLMNEKGRDVFLKHQYIKTVIPTLAEDEYILEQLGEHLKTFSGYTEGYWKDLEPAEKKIMVISIANGSYVRSLGNVGEQLSSSDVNGKFVILNGLNYMSNNSFHKLKYMEV